MTWKHRLIGLLAALLGVDLEETFRTTETETWVEHVPVVETEWMDPVEELDELPDEDGKIYCWQVSSDEAGKQMASILREEFIEKLGREPKAAHVILTDEEQLRELDPDQLRAHVKPFDGGGG
ncbi:hypothetical protein [Natronoglomus mannanivorans]|uniref:Uncharacterized protein n=1 Tax=Natronoglomus mannanivorans TaxID=2979990 RepID=A0AAP2Z246_9EURY|nr:hypothetical protein [Halobacteria archaeon AArc-xg1-1]